jgi:plastocyanin
MSLRMRQILLLTLLVLGICQPGFAKNWEVQVGGTSSSGGDGYGGGYNNPILAFSPTPLTITAGDSVTFTNLGGAAHNVHADDDSFRCANGCDGQGGNGDPSAASWSFTLTFATPGTINYHCDNHVSMGMTGSIIVNAAAPPPITLGGYMSGNWYDPSQSGHGFELEFTSQPSGTPGQNALVAYWYVYAPEGGTQNWIFAEGPYDTTANTVSLPAFFLTGAKFPPLFDSSALVQTNWGTLTFTFTDCNNGTASWASTAAGYGSGSIPIVRITSVAGTTCPAQ